MTALRGPRGLGAAVLAAATASAAPLLAQPDGALEIPLITAPADCGPGAVETSEVVVCGRRPDNERHRIPPQLRQEEARRDQSWSAEMRDDRGLARYDAQTVGPSGTFKHSLQVYCQWRAERQQINGHAPDCTRRVRPRATE